MREAVNRAEILSLAHDNGRRFEEHELAFRSIAVVGTTKEKENDNTDEHCGSATKQTRTFDKPTIRKCWRCGFEHIPFDCPAKNVRCFNCNWLGHYNKVCRNAPSVIPYKPREETASSMLANIDCSLVESIIELKINNGQMQALLDTSASENFMDYKLARELGLKLKAEAYGSEALADKKQRSKIGEKQWQI